MCGVLSRGSKGSRNYVIRWERSKCFVIGSTEDFNIYKNNEGKKSNSSSYSTHLSQCISYLSVTWLSWEWIFQDFSRYFSSNGSVSHFGFSSHSSEKKAIKVSFFSQCGVVLPCGAQPCAGGRGPVFVVGMSWLCSCVLFSTLIDYGLRKIMIEFLWAWDKGKSLSFLNFLAYYCGPICLMASCDGMMKIKHYLSERYDKPVLNYWVSVDSS